MGVDKFYIYDNDSTDRLKDVLRPYIEAGIAEYIYYPKKQSQTYMCNDAIKKKLKMRPTGLRSLIQMNLSYQKKWTQN